MRNRKNKVVGKLFGPRNLVNETYFTRRADLSYAAFDLHAASATQDQVDVIILALSTMPPYDFKGAA